MTVSDDPLSNRHTFDTGTLVPLGPKDLVAAAGVQALPPHRGVGRASRPVDDSAYVHLSPAAIEEAIRLLEHPFQALAVARIRRAADVNVAKC